MSDTHDEVPSKDKSLSGFECGFSETKEDVFLCILNFSLVAEDPSERDCTSGFKSGVLEALDDVFSGT